MSKLTENRDYKVIMPLTEEKEMLSQREFEFAKEESLVGACVFNYSRPTMQAGYSTRVFVKAGDDEDLLYLFQGRAINGDWMTTKLPAAAKTYPGMEVILVGKTFAVRSWLPEDKTKMPYKLSIAAATERSKQWPSNVRHDVDALFALAVAAESNK